MIDRVQRLLSRKEQIEQRMGDPNFHRDAQKAAEVMREHAHLVDVAEVWNLYQRLETQIEENRELLHHEKDPEIREMAREELEDLEIRFEKTQQQLKMLLVPPDPLDGKNIIMEIRAGTGGEEAGLFAADLYRMYTRFAELKGWKSEIIDANQTEIGGFKEIIVSLAGRDVYSYLKYESGVHRVQRVPTTESGGRIHTSAVTVAVLPEAEETDITIKPEELRVDVFRSSGPGGQSVNTTDSAVRVTHIPSGIVVSCQDEKSQHKNKAKALRVLKARLFEMEERKRQEEMAQERRSQVGSGDRSERIRTYNFPQNRLTDHRINLTLYRLDSIIQGELTEVIDALHLNSVESQLEKVSQE